MPDFQKHFLTEDFPSLNKELHNIHLMSLSAIERSMDGDMKAAELAWQQMQNSLLIIKALHNKKRKRDEHNMMAVGVQNSFH